MKMEEEGKNLKLSIVIEIMIQSFANCGVITVPLIIIAFNKTPTLDIAEILFYIYFWVSLVFEHTADL